MRDYCYAVPFEDGRTIEVFAPCKSAAIILARAKRIELGENWHLHIDETKIHTLA